MRLVCVVLAGGEGRRMGGAKPLQAFERGTLIGQALQLARRYADQIAVAVRDAEQLTGLQVATILDDPSIEGPLGGLASALDHASLSDADGVLTIPCDAPRLPADLAERLATALEAATAADAAVAASGGRLHPVCALWRTSARGRLPGYLASGARSLHGFADACEAVRVEWAAEPVDPFANANTPEELAALQKDSR